MSFSFNTEKFSVRHMWIKHSSYDKRSFLRKLDSTVIGCCCNWFVIVNCNCNCCNWSPTVSTSVSKLDIAKGLMKPLDIYIKKENLAVRNVDTVLVRPVLNTQHLCLFWTIQRVQNKCRKPKEIQQIKIIQTSFSF